MSGYNRNKDTMKKLIGKVTEEEKNEIQTFFERFVML